VLGSLIYTVIGNTYDMYSVLNPGQANQVATLLRSFTATIDGWQSFNIAAQAVPGNTTFDFLAIVQEPAPTPIEVTTSYNYLTPQNPAIPTAGQIQHSRSQPDFMQIDYIDNDAVDRTVLIQNLTAGDNIDIGLVTFVVQSNSDQTTFADIVVSPAVTVAAGIQDVIFETVTQTQIAVAEDANYWPTSTTFPLTQGLHGVDIPYDDIVPDTTAYGIDLLVQPAYVPNPLEWRLKVVSGAGGTPELNAIETRWVQQSSTITSEIDIVTTTDGIATELDRRTLLPGEAIDASYVIFARRFDGIGMYKATMKVLAWYDAGAIVYDRLEENGIPQLSATATASGDDVVVSVIGRPGQTWDWQTVVFYRITNT
jgi:hypothetical protein